MYFIDVALSLFYFDMVKSVAIVLFTLCLICKGDNSVRSFNKMTFSDNIPSSEGKTWVIML